MVQRFAFKFSMAYVKQEPTETVKSEVVYVKIEPAWNEAESFNTENDGNGSIIEPEVRIKVEPCEVKVEYDEQPKPPQLDTFNNPASVKLTGEQPASDLSNDSPKKRARRKDIICDVCNRQFKKTALLKRHIRIHTGEKPYSCEICNKPFTHLSAFNRHRRNHNGARPYGCEICQKQFTELHNYVTHKRIHSGEKPYSCEVCKKSFIKSTDLNKHRRIHTGEKPFACDICKKQFTCSGNLTKHKRTHTGEKRHCCESCDKQFTKRIYLEKHRLVHAEEKLFAAPVHPPEVVLGP